MLPFITILLHPVPFCSISVVWRPKKENVTAHSLADLRSKWKKKHTHTHTKPNMCRLAAQTLLATFFFIFPHFHFLFTQTMKLNVLWLYLSPICDITDAHIHINLSVRTHLPAKSTSSPMKKKRYALIVNLNISFWSREKECDSPRRHWCCHRLHYRARTSPSILRRLWNERRAKWILLYSHACVCVEMRAIRRPWYRLLHTRTNIVRICTPNIKWSEEEKWKVRRMWGNDFTPAGLCFLYIVFSW